MQQNSNERVKPGMESSFAPGNINASHVAQKAYQASAKDTHAAIDSAIVAKNKAVPRGIEVATNVYMVEEDNGIICIRVDTKRNVDVTTKTSKDKPVSQATMRFPLKSGRIWRGTIDAWLDNAPRGTNTNEAPKMPSELTKFNALQELANKDGMDIPAYLKSKRNMQDVDIERLMEKFERIRKSYDDAVAAYNGTLIDDILNS